MVYGSKCFLLLISMLIMLPSIAIGLITIYIPFLLLSLIGIDIYKILIVSKCWNLITYYVTRVQWFVKHLSLETFPMPIKSLEN